MKKIYQFIFTILFFITCLSICKVNTFAEDNVAHNYEVTVDVNDDGTLTVNYHIEEINNYYKEYLELYVPNASSAICTVLKNVSYIECENTKNKLRIYSDNFDEPIDVTVSIYVGGLVSEAEEGCAEVLYKFIVPEQDMNGKINITIKWNSDQIYNADSGYKIDGNYYVWDYSGFTTAEVHVRYQKGVHNLAYTTKEQDRHIPFAILGTALLAIALWVLKSFLMEKAGEKLSSMNLSGVTGKEILYNPICKNCGTTNPDGSIKCKQCGNSLAESEVGLTEEELKQKLGYFSKTKKRGQYVSLTNPNDRIFSHKKINLFNNRKG